MAGAAMITRDQIRLLKRGAHAHRNRLLAAVRMSAAEHRLALVKLVELFFEGPHQNHLAQHLFSLRRIEQQLLRDLYLPTWGLRPKYSQSILGCSYLGSRELSR